MFLDYESVESSQHGSFFQFILKSIDEGLRQADEVRQRLSSFYNKSFIKPSLLNI
jgi:hypothetical protein